MKLSFKRLTAACLCLFTLFSLAGIRTVRAEEAQETTTARNIASYDTVTDSTGFGSDLQLYDGEEDWGNPARPNSSVTLESDTGIASLYIVFKEVQSIYTVTDNATGTSYTRENPFLHDLLDLEAAFGTVPTSITIQFGPEELTIYELYAFTPGTLPDFVQQWKAPAEGSADLVLFSTHGDDEHLFFAGILPYYAGELGYQVQVVYLTDHHNNMGGTRMREMLDGLWAVGVDIYPVFGPYPDFLQKELSTAYNQFARYNISREDLIGFVAENLRRFKPKVAIGHDFAGEYGHGQHMVYADVLAAAIEISMDPAQYSESAEAYGVWDVPKTYIHLYEENPIVLDWDQPLEAFDGHSAYYVSTQIGFQKHKSQVKDFEWYYFGVDTAADIPLFNPCYYGLLRSTVGEDVEKNDFFENVTTYAEDAILEAQRLQAEEEARLKAEEEARLKAEEEARLKAEEEARRASEEAARQESLAQATAEATQPTEAAPAPSQPGGWRNWHVLALLAVVVILVIILLRRKRIKKYF